MSKNNDLLKEAIADAKAVRETAIANAKLALRSIHSKTSIYVICKITRR
tara:strand:- start:318 stop:464 length:147 start_codon:yes stop_codon:yes gene_type:complete